MDRVQLKAIYLRKAKEAEEKAAKARDTQVKDKVVGNCERIPAASPTHLARN